MLDDQLEALPPLPMQDHSGHADDPRRIAAQRCVLKVAQRERRALCLDQLKEPNVLVLLDERRRGCHVRCRRGILEVDLGDGGKGDTGVGAEGVEGVEGVEYEGEEEEEGATADQVGGVGEDR